LKKKIASVYAGIEAESTDEYKCWTREPPADHVVPPNIKSK